MGDVTMNLNDLIESTTIDNYYYYEVSCLKFRWYPHNTIKGSLTVPDCTENTKWIISMDKLKISESQLDKLRALKTNDYDIDYLRDNFRPTQPLNGRNVFMR